MKKLAVLPVSLLVSGACLGQSTTRMELETSKKRLQIQTVVGTTANLHKEESADSVRVGTIQIKPSFKIGENYKVKSFLSLEHDFSKENEVTVSNTKVGIQRNPISTKIGLLIPSINGSLPTSEQDRTENSLLGAIDISGVLLKDISIFSKPTTIGGSAKIQKNFHQWDINSQGAFNTSHAISETLFVDQPVSRKLTLSAYINYRTGWTYRGVLKSAFGIGQSISYQPNSKTAISLGHDNMGNALQANGRDTNISWYDSNTSTITASVSMTY